MRDGKPQRDRATEWTQPRLSPAKLLERAGQAVEAGRPDEAIDILLRALQIGPGLVQARQQCAALLLDTDRAGEAMPHIERLHAADPGNKAWLTMLATCCARIGQYSRSADLYGQLAARTPGDANLWLTYGSSLRHTGRRAEALEAFRKCIALAPEKGAAYLAIHNIDADGLSAQETARLEAQVARTDLGAPALSHLHYALASVRERHGDFAASFALYAKAARLRRGTIRYNPAHTTSQVSRLIGLYTPEFLAARQGGGHPDPAPIFIVGMPRAGSTLIEQILSTHSAIEGTMELPELANIVRALVALVAGGDASTFPECIARASAAELADAGALYVARVQPYRQTGKLFFTDKMPFSWLHAGLIHLILPNAKIIDARRDAMATCFSAFTHDFATGQRFSYDLRELAQYYRDYVRLMDHFDAVLPGRIHRVDYERMVHDTQGEVRRLLEYCVVPFEPECLEYWRNERAVSTASAEQVRRPLYRTGIDGWRRFEAFLGPLRAALEGG